LTYLMTRITASLFHFMEMYCKILIQ